MNILIFNCGSSSQSFKVYSIVKESPPKVVASGKAKNVATKTKAEPQIDWQINGQKGSKQADLSSHRLAAIENLRLLQEHGVTVDAVGHRFVHGGEFFTSTALITSETTEKLKACFHLAPIHNPNSYSVIDVCREMLPGVPQYAVFDTAFHASLSPEAFRYALPLDLAARHGLRKYGFHGLSYTYVSKRAAALLGKPVDHIKLVMCHLGTGGSSVCAFANGHSVETSMGYSPLAGLVMSTRSGDIDAEVVLELLRSGMQAEEIDEMLNNRSGLIGLSGVSSNLEEVIAEGEKGSEDCRVAAGVYANRLKLYLGGYYWMLNGADAIVFTDSVGTQSWKLREMVCGGVESLGIRLDREKNRLTSAARESFIEAAGSTARILVIPTDEESVILDEVIQALNQ